MSRLLLILMILLLTGCEQQDLLNDLDQKQANEVLAVLQRQNIYAEKFKEAKNTYTILVDERDFPAAVDWLKIYHLPARPDINVSELFPADSLVSSPRAEKARLYSAIEQRLEQTLRTMDGILSARVHVSYDIEAGEGGKEAAPVHLAVLAIYDRYDNAQNKVNEIKRFLVNTFSEAKYENISVILTKGSEIQQYAPTAKVQQNNWSQEKLLAGVIIIMLFLSGGITYVWCRRETIIPVIANKLQRHRNKNKKDNI